MGLFVVSVSVLKDIENVIFLMNSKIGNFTIITLELVKHLYLKTVYDIIYFLQESNYSGMLHYVYSIFQQGQQYPRSKHNTYNA